jgi:hypothetical protein
MTSVSRFVFVAAVAASSIAGDVYAHHSYAAFDRCKPVVLEGEINKIEWVNPHIVIDLRTKDANNYRIEWFALGQLAQANIATETLRSGDHVVITGAPMRDPNLKLLSLLSEIRRPSDGWRWGRQRQRPQECPAG